MTRRTTVCSLLVSAALVASCAGSAADTTAGSTASTTTAPATTTTTTASPTTTATTAPPTTTTTEPAFDLSSLDEFQLNATNYTCASVTDVPRQPNGQLFSMDWFLERNFLLSGEEIQPFLDAVVDMDVRSVETDELKQALAAACLEIGAPTDEYLAQFSG
jgi:phosphate-selective porin